jgi:hypothetical protein
MIGIVLFLLAAYFYLSDEKRYLSIFLLFTIATAGFQLLPVNWVIMPAIGISKPYDWLLIFCGMIFLLFPKVFIQNGAWPSYRNITLFALVLIALLCYSIFYIGVEVSIGVRVFRNFIFFITLFLFINISLQDFIKLFRLIIYVTTIASFVYCLQLVVGKVLLNTVGSDVVTTNDDAALTRYYNLPVFLFPVVFFFFFRKNICPLKFRNILIGINFLAIILSQHRNLLLAIIACYLLHLFLSKKIKPAKLFVYVFLAFLAFNVGNSLLDNRFSDGFKDISGASVSVSPTTLHALSVNELSTTEFRWYLFAERLQHVLLNPITTLFGVGFLTEDSRLTRLLRFNIGLPDDANNVVQVDTGDIIWSVMILQFGIVGIFFFVIYYGSFLLKFLVFKENPIAQIGILFIAILFITSFYGTAILQPYTTCMLMLFVAYTFALKQSENSLYESNYLINSQKNIA